MRLPAPRKCLMVMLVIGLSLPARADHTSSQFLSDPTPVPAPLFFTYGTGELAGKWEHVANFLPNPGSDNYTFQFSPNSNADVYASVGTLGQGDVAHVGQRFLKLVAGGKPLETPVVVADHGSAACTTEARNTTGLQHDQVVVPRRKGQLAIDATDATQRCHDPGAGGLEFIDISGLPSGALPKEIHLVRLDGFSHNVTADPTRPWIIYSSNSSFGVGAITLIDVLDIRSCLYPDPQAVTLQQKRESCRPKVHRISFQPKWTNPEGADTTASCHDISVRNGRLYCAAVSATLVLDVQKLVRADGSIDAPELIGCDVVAGTRTGAAVTDCRAKPATTPASVGWRFLGTFAHAAGAHTSTSRADEEIAISHEAISPDGKWLFVTDERGGGAVPVGASCAPGVDNPLGNGGLHVFRMTGKSDGGLDLQYALTPDGRRAVYISQNIVPASDFCTIHRLELIPDENRIIVAYYSQGIKIVDYFIDENDRWTFRETAALLLPNAITWTARPYHIEDNAETGERTYSILASDIGRGIDVVKWTGKPNFPPKSKGADPVIEEELPIPFPSATLQ